VTGAGKKKGRWTKTRKTKEGMKREKYTVPKSDGKKKTARDRNCQELPWVRRTEKSNSMRKGRKIPAYGKKITSKTSQTQWGEEVFAGKKPISKRGGAKRGAEKDGDHAEHGV